MDFLLKHKVNDLELQKRVKKLHELYARKLLAYTKNRYQINEDDAQSLVYKTIYKIADVEDNYKFENENKQAAFVFKTHINYLRNYFRDSKTFETKNKEITLVDFVANTDESEEIPNQKLKLLQLLLDRMEEWQRILLLMRGQDMPYSEISKFVQKPEKQLKVYYARLKKQLLEDMENELIKSNNEKR